MAVAWVSELVDSGHARACKLSKKSKQKSKSKNKTQIFGFASVCFCNNTNWPYKRHGVRGRATSCEVHRPFGSLPFLISVLDNRRPRRWRLARGLIFSRTLFFAKKAMDFTRVRVNKLTEPVTLSD